MHRQRALAILPALLLAAASTARAQALGPFDESSDVGGATPGSVAYDEDTQSLRISGSGANMWFDHDEFRFVWKRLRGDFIVRTRGRLLGTGGNPHRKIGWSARASLEADAPHVSAAVHGDGLTSLQFRRSPGAQTEEVASADSAPDVIQLERRGNRFVMSTATMGSRFTTVDTVDVDLGEEVYVGLFVCAHDADALEEAEFRDVRLITPASEGFTPYRDYLGANIEILDLETRNRRIVYRAPEALQAPNWTTDGSALIYNAGGRLYRFDLETRMPRPIDTGGIVRNNNDHVISFDGTKLGISSASPEGESSVVYTVPIEGGTPRRVTAESPSYLHGWSPDGRYLLYTGGRNDEWDIYRISVEGGDEARLTDAPGLDDGSEYSPDGEWIYFNSSRTGSMEIWRMRPDGTNQQQLTRDDLNNWFPHVSPDGQWVVFLSYGPEVDPEDHPWYRQVYLRLMPTAGGEPEVIAYLYGGQGSINVPSWSPDSRQIAFVSNTGM